ncbi:MAG: translation factor SUA5 [Ignavibacteria bacterium]|nr:MAG: translation factor SUA5 [Ignavibacteria bacterium]KAF0158918.1 MAG: translation factor SUA5 [Ignavibacteria bacterium]
MNTYKANSKNIKKAAHIIKAGGLVAFPTETVYGLGADGLNPIAVAKIFEVKKRPSFNPLILHISDKSWLKKLTTVKREKIDLLIKKFWPGPLTLVLPKTELVPEIVTSGNPTVAVRMPNHPVALQLIETSKRPIAAPSANRFGHLSPTEASHVSKYLGDKVDMILDGGKSSVGVESTILQFYEDNFYLLRHGGLSKEEIENEVGKIKTGTMNEQKPNSPGQLPFHYSPHTPLKFFNKKLLDEKKKIGAIFLRQNKLDFPFAKIKLLSEQADLREAAANLFSFLHDLEKENLDLIIVEKIEETGLGRAIMDRLKKAVKQHE